MNKTDQPAEWEQIRDKSEAVHLAAGRVEDLARMLEVCVNPESEDKAYLDTARQRLTDGTRELIARVEALAVHGKR